MKKKTNCECCVYYRYEEEYGCYTCESDLDEDEMSRFITGTFSFCPYFRLDDEYQIVRKQM